MNKHWLLISHVAMDPETRQACTTGEQIRLAHTTTYTRTPNLNEFIINDFTSKLLISNCKKYKNKN